MNDWQLALLALSLWVAVCSCLVALWIGLCVLGERNSRRRHPGYIPLSPRASASANPGMVARVVTYTGCSTAGPRPGEPAGPKTQPAPNRTTARGVSTNASGPHRGAPMTDADPRPGTWDESYPPFPSGFGIVP